MIIRTAGGDGISEPAEHTELSALSGKQAAVCCLLLVAAVGGVYWNSFPGAFHYDDFAFVLENPLVVGEAFPWTAFLVQEGGRPLTLWTFRLNFLAAGDSPKAFHAISVLLHLAVCVLLFLLLYQWRQRLGVALGGALLFGIHPLQTQAVNYIWSRSMLLMAFFSLLTLLLHRYRWLSLVLFQLAIWSRVEALCLLLPLLVLAPRRRDLAWLGFLNLGTVLGHLYWRAPSQVAWLHTDPYTYWTDALYAIWRYPALFLWPVDLCIDAQPVSPNFFVSVLSAAALLGCLLSLCTNGTGWMEWRRGLGWFLIFLIAPLTIPNSDVFNESRVYLALAGMCWIAALLLERLLRVAAGRSPITAAIGGLLVVGILGTSWVAQTLDRNRIWQDDAALWEQTASLYPKNARAHYNLGVAWAERGQIARAERSFQRALCLNPKDSLNYAALGYCAQIEHRAGEAISLYQTALRLDPFNDYARAMLIGLSDHSKTSNY